MSSPTRTRIWYFNILWSKTKELIVEVATLSCTLQALTKKTYDGDSPYNVMFGPDICGSTRRTHVILTKNDKNHLIKDDIPTETDTVTHVYTLILKPDNTFQVLTDNKESRAGSIEDHFDILEPKEIPDPDLSKPADWVDQSHINDPEDIKPEGYDEITPEIEDPEAAKPSDWDDELDGEWEAPKVPNPAYKGPWRPKSISNPDYKGEWVHPKIANPKYAPDASLYSFKSFKYLGIEVWQVKSGSVFGNFLVTDDIDLAKTEADAILSRVQAERDLETAADEAQRKKEAEEAKAAAAEGDENEKEDL